MARKPSKTVIATGVFDILHPGHIRFLEESKKAGGPGSRLVVVVARDKTVIDRKGRKPVMPEEQRKIIVSALKPVDKVVLGHRTLDFLGVLKEYDPSIVCVGYDQTDIKRSVEKIIRAEHLPVKVVQIGRYGPKGLDSSTVVKREVARRLE